MYVDNFIHFGVFPCLFSRPSKVVRPRRSDESVPSSKAVSRPSVGGARKPASSVASRAGGGGGGKVIDSRGRVGGAGGGGARKGTPGGGGGGVKKSVSKEKVYSSVYN